MIMQIQHKAGLLAAVALFALPLALATRMPAHGQTAAPQAQPPFRLGFGDMMIMAVQPRHTKMWLAVQAKNWDLASWNYDELDETFRRLGRLFPKVDGVDITPGMLMVKGPMDSLKKAIDVKNEKDFAASYELLTQACNACHMTYKNPMISIKIPNGGGEQFSDQDFAPAK
jgi:hypothetical protein